MDATVPHATMLRCAPGSLVWDADFVRICLRAADACGEKTLYAVQSALHSALTTGGHFINARWEATGQPHRRDIEQRDTAAKIAALTVRGSVEEQFYRALSLSAEKWIDRSIFEPNPRQTAGNGKDGRGNRNHESAARDRLYGAHEVSVLLIAGVGPD